MENLRRVSTTEFLFRVVSRGLVISSFSLTMWQPLLHSSQIFYSCRCAVGVFLCSPQALAKSLCKCCHQYSSLDPRKVQFYFNKENCWLKGIRTVSCILSLLCIFKNLLALVRFRQPLKNNNRLPKPWLPGIVFWLDSVLSSLNFKNLRTSEVTIIAKPMEHGAFLGKVTVNHSGMFWLQ